jgi:hypothetical protein
MAIFTNWIFERDSTTALGFLSSQRASTDALNALFKWEAKIAGRSHEVIHEEDDVIQASLTCDPSDSDAGSDLDACCAQHGVQRRSTE